MFSSTDDERDTDVEDEMSEESDQEETVKPEVEERTQERPQATDQNDRKDAIEALLMLTAISHPEPPIPLVNISVIVQSVNVV